MSAQNGPMNVLRLFSGAVAVVMLSGCPAPTSDTNNTEPVALNSPSPPTTASTQPSVPTVDPAELDRAMARARRTAPSAAERWRTSHPDDQTRWLVKWAAPTRDAHTEYVWVVPVHWSRFRIEGRLISEPKRAWSPDRTQGDLVGFAVEELADWIAPESALDPGPRGGFTVE